MDSLDSLTTPPLNPTVSQFDGRQSIVLRAPTETKDERLNACYDAIVHGQSLDWTESHQFQRILGTGGQGIVFLCERAGADGFRLPVALKVFSPLRYAGPVSYEADMARMARVAMRVAQIQQDHLLDVLNFVAADRIRIMEMEWVDGFDLERLLSLEMLDRVRSRLEPAGWRYLNDVIVTSGVHQPRLKPGIAIAVLRDGLAALSALHRQGIVHGDVKPSNIMLKRTGDAKLIDIGAAFDTEQPPERSVCTPAYAAPEVLAGQRGDARSDLASLGYVLLEMLSGVRIFDGIQDVDEMRDRKEGSLRSLTEHLPGEVLRNELLMNLVERLISPDADQRFPSAEAADFLEQGAASFQRQLVKGNLASEYFVDIQTWLQGVG